MEWVKVRAAAEQVSIQPRWKGGRIAPHDMTVGATAVDGRVAPFKAGDSVIVAVVHLSQLLLGRLLSGGVPSGFESSGWRFHQLLGFTSEFY